MKYNHIENKSTFLEQLKEGTINDNDISLIEETNEVYTHGRYYKRYEWGEIANPKHTIEFIFNQTGQGEVVAPIFDDGLLDYLAENIKIYQGKYQEDGSMIVCPALAEVNKETYYFSASKFIDGSPLPDQTGVNSNVEFFTKIPTIYYKCDEIEPDKFDIKFSASPFIGAHKVFGNDILIGFQSGTYKNGKYYTGYDYFTDSISFTQAREAVAARGKGYYGFTSDEFGVIMFLNIFHSGVNGDVTNYGNSFLGVADKFSNGSSARNFIPNIYINNTVAEVHHLDGKIEQLKVPYIWSKSFSKLYIGEYLTILPKEEGTGIYNSGNSNWMGNSEGIAVYLPDYSVYGKWAFSADRSDESIKGRPLKIRPCFKGKIVETQDVDYFKSLPIIN